MFCQSAISVFTKHSNVSYLISGTSQGNQKKYNIRSENRESTKFLEEIHLLFKIFKTCKARRDSTLVKLLNVLVNVRIINIQLSLKIESIFQSSPLFYPTSIILSINSADVNREKHVSKQTDFRQFWYNMWSWDIVFYWELAVVNNSM